MKTKIILFIGAVAVVTLSFTFSTVQKRNINVHKIEANASAPIGGLISDEIIK